MGFVAGRLMTNTKQRSFENVQEQLKDSITFKAEKKVILEKIVLDVDASERGNVYQGSETELYNMYSSASITCIANPKYSSGEAIQAMEELIQEQLGDNFGYEWTSVAY